MCVPDDPPAFLDRGGHGGETATEQHEVAHALRDLAPRSHRNRKARLLEGQYVVDSVADHRHVATAARERRDDVALLLGRDARKYHRGVRGALQLRGVGGHVLA